MSTSKPLSLLGLLIAILILSTPKAKAEVLECKGSASTSPPTRIEISVNMDKGKSSLRWVYPDGRGITQGQRINRRTYPSDGFVAYLSEGSSRVSLQIPLKNSSPLNGTFTHGPQGLNSVPIVCELNGVIPPAPVCPVDRDNALLKAMDTAETIDEVEFILNKCDADPNVVNAKGCTPLMLAIDPECHPGSASGQITDTAGLIDFFLNNGAFVNLQDRKGETALMKAVRAGLHNVYDSFIAAEADFDLKDRHGNTALMHAAYEGDKWVIEDILLGSPDRRLKNKAGQTAFDIAKHWHDRETADLVRIPDKVLTVMGKNDGTCTPLGLEVNASETFEIALTASDKMFLLESRSIGLQLMADSRQTVKKIMSLPNRGEFKFTCGFHGGNSVSEGIIYVK